MCRGRGQGFWTAILAYTLILCIGTARAQDTGSGTDEDEYRVQPVVVTGTRVERSPDEEVIATYRIEREEMEFAGTRSVGDMLRWVPGIDISGGATFGASKRSTALLYGLPAQYSLILIDGQRTKSDHIHTGVNLEILPLSMIERIEVIRGPGTALYGSDALGGIVNIITKSAPKEPTLDVMATYGSEETLELNAFHGMSWERFGYVIVLNDETSDGPGTGNQYDKSSVFLKLYGEPAEGLTTRASVRYYEGDYATSTDDLAQYQVEAVLKEILPGRLKGSMAYTDYNRIFRSGSAITDNDMIESVLQYDRHLGERHYLVVGGEWRHERFERLGVLKKKEDIGSMYLQDEIRILDPLHLLLGLRMDHQEEIGAEISPRGALHLGQDLYDVRLSVAQGLRCPSLQDRYEYRFDHGTFWRDGNPDLDSERSLHYSLEGEVRIPEAPVAVRAMAFRNDLDDVIALRDTGILESDGDPVLTRVNLTKAHTQGFEVGMHTYEPTECGLGGRLSYGFLDAEDETTGQRLAYDPKHTFKAGIFFNRGRFSSSLMGEAALDRKYRDKNDRVRGLDDYYVLDLNVAYEISEWLKVSLSVKNLLNEEFETYEEGTAASSYGRFVAVSLNGRFK